MHSCLIELMILPSTWRYVISHTIHGTVYLPTFGLGFRNLANHGIFTISTGAGFLPSTVAPEKRESFKRKGNINVLATQRVQLILWKAVSLYPSMATLKLWSAANWTLKTGGPKKAIISTGQRIWFWQEWCNSDMNTCTCQNDDRLI